MPTNQYGVTEFDADPETAAELLKLKQQQKIADAMMGRGQQNIQGQMVGGVYVKPSITQGLAQLFNAYSGRKASDDVAGGYKTLADDRRIMEGNERNKIMEVLSGRPEQPMGPPTESGEMGVSPAVPAGTRDQVMQALMASKLPAYRDAGLRGMIADKTKTTNWQVVEKYDDKGNKQKVLINPADPTQTMPFGGSAREPAFKTGHVRERIAGEQAVQEELQGDGTWKEVGRGPRFARQVGAGGSATPKAPSGYRYTPEGDLEAIKGGPADVKAQIQQQKEVDKAAGVDKQLDAIERNIDKIMTPEGKAKPALKSYTGQLDQYYPEWAMSSDTAAAGSALKSLQEQMTMMNLAGAKAAVGQSFGSMQVKEWDKFMNLLTNVSRGVPDAEMESNVKFIRDFVKDKRDVLRTAIYGGTHGIGGPKPAAGGKSAAGQVGGPKKVASDAEYNALESGAIFIDPQGNQRRKP